MSFILQRPSLGIIFLKRDANSGRKLVCTWAYATQVKKSNEDEICFKSYFIPRNVWI
jgi:hypothetical protein